MPIFCLYTYIPSRSVGDIWKGKLIFWNLHNSFTYYLYSKVIHGTDLKEKYQKARTRRLYDVSNVFLAISERYPLIAKVRATRVGTQNTTAFQYCGPELETVSIDSDTIFNLPDYRRKHLCFDYGKQLLGKDLWRNGWNTPYIFIFEITR